MLNLSKENIKGFDLKANLILLFVFGGIAEFSNKIFQNYALNDYKGIFLSSIFFVAFLVSLYFTKKGKENKNNKRCCHRFCSGDSQSFFILFLLLSLDSFVTSVAFPIYLAGSIVFINMGGYLIFKEKIDGKTKIAIVLTVFTLILINL